MAPDSLVVALFLCSIALPFIYIRSRRPGKLPPGPRLVSFFISLFPIPTKGSSLPRWKKLAMIQKAYGPIASLYHGKTLVVVLGTIKAANDLLEKRGNIYSSRPRNIMSNELLSGGMRGTAMPYGPRWRNWRSVLHAGMGIEASQNYRSLQSLESKILLNDFMTERDSNQYLFHIRRFAISIVFCVAYGRRILSLDNPLVIANLKTEEVVLSLPGKFLVDAWPILLKLPRRLQWFRHAPEAQREVDAKLYLSLMNDVRKQMELGVAQQSTAKRALEKQEEFGLNDLECAFGLSAPFAAGVGTTVATLQVFFLAMLHHPQAMKKAQSEIDGVVGFNRLPEYDDASSLPYIRALIKEVMRWRPIAPFGVPHCVIVDDIYEDDIFIPKGSSVISNIYSMSKDENVFPSAEEFKPERYLDENGTDLIPHDDFFFGFGRRICPGMHVAQNSLFIVISRILWAFDVLPPKDGKLPSTATEDFLGDLVLRPAPFNFSLNLRGDKTGPNGLTNLISQGAKKATEEGEAWLY